MPTRAPGAAIFAFMIGLPTVGDARIDYGPAAWRKARHYFAAAIIAIIELPRRRAAICHAARVTRRILPADFSPPPKPLAGRRAPAAACRRAEARRTHGVTYLMAGMPAAQMVFYARRRLLARWPGALTSF